MSWLSSAIGSALTPRGTAAANADTNAKKRPQQIAGGLLNTLQPGLEQQTQFAVDFEPQRRRAIWDMYQLGNPYAGSTTAAGVRSGLTGAATASLPGLEQALTAGGAGIGSIQGARAGVLNDAHSRANEILAWYSSPQGKAYLNSIRMQAIQQAQSTPLVNNLGSLSNIIYGRPAPAVGPSPLAGIAGLAGSYFGGMGGGGGGSAAAPAAGGYVPTNPSPGTWTLPVRYP